MKRITRNNVVVVACLAVVAGMVGMSYAAVPLYYAFCRATGYGGTPARADAAPGAVGDRLMTVRFDTNIDPKLPWLFEPEQRSVRVKIGEDRLVFFRAKNQSDRAIVGHASFNVEPENAARYFNKIQCFCFTEQKLEPGESVDMPVTFFVSPTLLNDRREDNLTEITLSYTFYPSPDQTAAVSASRSTKGSGG